MDAAYRFVKRIIGIYRMLFIHHIDVRGIENLPPGPKIIVANHANVTDSFALPFILKEKLHFVIQGSFFDLPVIGKLLDLADQVPCYAGQGMKMIREAQEKLARGGCVVIYPEGRLDNNEGLLKAGIGAAMLAVKAHVPVIPLGFYVSKENIRTMKWKVFPDYESHGGFQWRGACMLRFGEPLMVTIDEEKSKIQGRMRKVTGELMDQIRTLVEAGREDWEKLNYGLVKNRLGS